ncbi:competence protein ComK [Alkalihalobacillus sp. LMS39]|uniref:competence protein ComK n=1 Tax=Alkalihalobacillus sp. LMS39 TaxID=2924032 RepID=UPI001FB4B699|nr:competence protein ComK [Alkalihalobacillus sp. LMS39]UOE93882.1 competence protein ComK [Alkalihalobacillus sp. LMS39]
MGKYKELDYMINAHTMLLKPVQHEKYGTLVYEKGCKFYTMFRPKDYIECACLEGGSSYAGRREAVLYSTTYRNKIPIPIFPEQSIIAFPTLSSSQFLCEWVFLHHIKGYKMLEKIVKEPRTQVDFSDGQYEDVMMSAYSFQEQMERASYCNFLFSKATMMNHT